MPRTVAPELLNALRDAEESGEASRPWFWAGYWLALCQQCPEFDGDHCERHAREAFLKLLTTGGKDFPRWPEIHDGR